MRVVTLALLAWILGLPAQAQVAAYAALEPSTSDGGSGRVAFWSVPGGVRVVATIDGVDEGFHGLRVAAAPSCEGLAGDVLPWSVDGAPHGPFQARPRAAGSLGNIDAADDGTGRYERVDPLLALDGPASIIGRAMVVTVRQDDYYSRPAGGAGPALLCGVIREGEG